MLKESVEPEIRQVQGKLDYVLTHQDDFAAMSDYINTVNELRGRLGTLQQQREPEKVDRLAAFGAAVEQYAKSHPQGKRKPSTKSQKEAPAGTTCTLPPSGGLRSSTGSVNVTSDRVGCDGEDVHTL